MKEQFVSYEIAKKLKDLEFNYSCCATYNTYNKELSGLPIEDMEGKPDNCLDYGWRNSLIHNSVITAPLYQQVSEWIAEKYNIHLGLNSSNGIGIKLNTPNPKVWWCEITPIGKNDSGARLDRGNHFFSNRFEALEDGINWFLDLVNDKEQFEEIQEIIGTLHFMSKTMPEGYDEHNHYKETKL